MSQSRYHGQRALVLGAAGFIGRWVTWALEAAGASVIRVTRQAAPGARQADLAVPGSAAALLRAERPAFVFNLAGYGVDPTERDPALAWRINVDLVAELLEALDGARLVHAGSALEYGERRDDLNEAAGCAPGTLYGTTKLQGTTLVRQAREARAKAMTARLFTVFGPGEDDRRLLPSLLRTAATGATLELTAGTQLRDFTYVEDVADGLLRLGLLAGEAPAIVNLATGRLHSVREFAEIAADVLGIPHERLKFGALPMRGEEMAHQPVNVKLMRSLTGWLPPTSIHDGIMRTAAFRS